MSTFPTIMKYKGIQIYQTPEEQKVIREILETIKNVPGDMAEVGVFEGATALIISEVVPDKLLHLFDTFTGLPKRIESVDPESYQEGQMAVNFQGILDRFEGKKVKFIKGIFPEIFDLNPTRFAFVHIDVDIYRTTLDALDIFYPLVNSGGAILIHDYPVHTGVKKAVEEFGTVGEQKSPRQYLIKKP